ncbi:hypothetical protein [Microlunatus ginsengisoli]|uniref:Uncharacterized protein n=1 Tax=Microlunatus ginsengisoli TaxID=363863 RepID=A0ABP7AZ34_9ACTN
MPATVAKPSSMITDRPIRPVDSAVLAVTSTAITTSTGDLSRFVIMIAADDAAGVRSDAAEV